MTKDTPTTVRERLRDFIRVCYGDDAWNEKFTDGVLSIFRSEQKALLERLRMEKESLPKNKCLNLETHKLGSCFSCEAIKGGNRKIDDFNAKIDAELAKLDAQPDRQ